MEFNPDLYDFLKENETHMWEDKNGLNFGVHIHFSDISGFIEIVGHFVLDDGGIATTLNNESSLFVPLEDIFVNYGYRLAHYKNCFDQHDVKIYQNAIKDFDED